MERQFINANFHYVRVVPIQNGVTWTVERLSKQIVTAYKAFGLQTEVVVWLDREKRAESAQEIVSYILAQLLAAGSDPAITHILVADIMSENIILADEALIRLEFNKPDYSYRFEGQNGKAIIKRLYGEQNVNYSEIKHGAALLKKIRMSNCALVSPAAQTLLRTLTRECWWLSSAARSEPDAGQ